MNMEIANKLLRENEASCVILEEGKIIYTSGYIGVKPLLIFLREQSSLCKEARLILIDKVIGKAAMILAAKCHIREVYAPIMSKEAIAVAEIHNIYYEADSIVPHIINREGTGICPLEASVIDTMDLNQGLANIESTVKKLMAKKRYDFIHKR